MIVGLLVGKETSIGFPGKHIKKVFGRPVVEYPLMAAKSSGYIQRIFVSTDSSFIASLGKKYGGTYLPRPKELAQPDTLLEDSLVFAHRQIIEQIQKPVEIVVLLFANSPMISAELIDKGIEALRERDDVDSVFSVCKLNMFSPARAHKIGDDGIIGPFVDLRHLGDVNSIRDSQGDCYFCDLQVQILRACCFENMAEGQLPYRWMGKKSLALTSDIGFDIDYEWQLPVAEYWLKSHGITE